MRDFFYKYIHNKYFYTGLIFLVWLIFFDQESMIDQYRLSNTLDGLEDQKAYYEEEIKNNEQTIYELENDTSKLERFAREKYYMKKENEEIFVIIEEEEK